MKDEIAELKQTLTELPQKSGNTPSGFFGPIDEVDALNRKFIEQLALGNTAVLEDVAALHEINIMADKLMDKDEPAEQVPA